MSPTSVSRPSLRSAIAVCLALVMVAGCYTHSAVRTRVSPEFAVAEMATPREEDDARGIRAVLLDDGSTVEFVEPVARDGDGMLRGTALVESGTDRSVTRAVEISWDRVREVEWQSQERKIHWGNTLGLALGIPAGILVAGMIWWSEGDGFNGLGEALSPLSSR